MRIVIPLTPPPELNPNARVHWAKRAKAVRQTRELACWAARATAGSTHFHGAVDVVVTINWERSRRSLDADNAIASCKAILDGLTDAGVWGDDRQIRHLRVTQGRDATGRGEVIVEVCAA